MKDKFTGLGVALITPFFEDGSVDYPSLSKLVAHCINGGANYLVVNGTTSEASTIEQDEKLAILSHILKENAGRLPIMYGIGANSTSYVKGLIDKTPLDEVDAILTVSPYYNKPSQRGIQAHFTAVADHSPVPVLLYNVPGRTGTNMSAKTTLELAKHPNIFGIKEASGDVPQLLAIAKDMPEDFMLISGDDMLTNAMISFGCQGVISVLGNAFPEHFSQMVSQALEGNFASANQLLFQFIEINDMLYAESNPVGIKEVLQHMGICKEYVRLPLATASAPLKEDISQALSEILVTK